MDFERARFNMVEQQIRPWNVLDQEVLDLLFVVKREDFVPPAYRAMAFTDMEIPLALDGKPTGENMLAPRVEARLLQALKLRKHEHVFEIGTGSGYMAGLLAQRARHVVSCEIHTGLADFAKANLARAGIRNVTVEARNGALPSGGSRFEAIVLSGSVPFVPQDMLQRLAVGGRMVAIVGEAPVMNGQLITRSTETGFAAENLFETSTKALVGFPSRDTFRF